MSSSFVSPSFSKNKQKYSKPSENGLSKLQSFHGNMKSNTSSAPSSPLTEQKNSNIHNGMLKCSQAYAQKSKNLMGLLNDSCSILKQVRETNKQRWDLHYPFVSQTPEMQSPLYNDIGHRIISNQNEMSKFKQKVTDRLQFQSDMSASQEFNSKLNVLKLDLKKGDTSSAETVFGDLKKDAIATLLDGCFANIIKRCENLHARISDTSSKVLVAGDVNAGKSTFVNALLKREVMPVDQQPCTTLFCEVLDVQENDGAEEIHAIKDFTSYKRTDASTYTVIEWKDLNETIVNNEDSGEYAQLKVYTKDRRNAQESLLHNGIIDIALIDCPGLNRDTLKTTALFARQEEIDVIIFVVSAENHFTLSAKEFLSNASNEKAYLFIVVNRFDNIRQQEKCRRAILEQIKEVSPRTHEHAKDLVHFVTSTAIKVEKDDDVNHSSRHSSAIDQNVNDIKSIEDFSRLEESLRTFVLKKRSKSKLAPAQHYLDNLVTDIGILVEYNKNIAHQENYKADLELKEAERALNKLVADEKVAVATADDVENRTCEEIGDFTRKSLERAIENVDKSTSCEYHGLVYIWSYANDLRDSMLDDIYREVLASEVNAKKQTAKCIESIQDLGRDLGGEAKQINLDKMFVKHGTPISINIEISDFFDFNLNDRFSEELSMVGLTGAAVMCTATKLNALSYLWDVTYFLGFNNMRRLVLPLVGLAGIGIATYVLYDTKRVISRKVSRKIRCYLKRSDYVNSQSNRIVRQGRKKMRLASDNIRERFRKAVEEEKSKQVTHHISYKKSEEAVKFFEKIFSQTEVVSDSLEDLLGNHEWEDYEEIPVSG
ncbi:11203_t:CDS:2 [Funneliformis geosporum]|uniref:3600_t:CDS:1 n=1 Tax=Funneliformis geosporum TaxID=1117311 RepID=A0A9W4SJY2_9GLOM|nr:11203_t:CDS:2 [Funneliformis geosporum]CAI2169703.1 3600_t:CDS:2 [Funneliformis geosporum]